MLVVLALGSNLGDRLAHLRFARAEIRASIAHGPLQSASLYESVPVDCPPGSPPFLNTVIAGETLLPAPQILAITQAIESAAGRIQNGGRNVPRPLDIDLLLLGDLLIRSPNLTVPHPRLHQRLFVLQPLAELAPDLVPPGLDLSARRLCASLSGLETPPSPFLSSW